MSETDEPDRPGVYCTVCRGSFNSFARATSDGLQYLSSLRVVVHRTSAPVWSMSCSRPPPLLLTTLNPNNSYAKYLGISS